MTFQPGIVDVSPEAYHVDSTTPVPSLSSTMARILLNRTPLHAWAASPRLQREFPHVDRAPAQPKESDAFDIGRACHAILLGRGGSIDVVLADDWAKKVAREQRAASREAGRTPLLLAQYEGAMRMAEAARRVLGEAKLELDPNRSEVAAYAEIEGVLCRVMIDNAPAWPTAPLIDYKTCEDASPEACLKSVQAYGYDFQWQWYREVWQAATGERRRLLFLFGEKSPPHEHQIIELYEGRGEGDWSQDAAEKCSEARRIFRNSLETGEWPGYPVRIATLHAPQWHRSRWADKQTISAPSIKTLREAREAQAPTETGIHMETEE